MLWRLFAVIDPQSGLVAYVSAEKGGNGFARRYTTPAAAAAEAAASLKHARENDFRPVFPMLGFGCFDDQNGRLWPLTDQDVPPSEPWPGYPKRTRSINRLN